MKQDVKVSVIIPVYNVERYLCECLDSVLAQSYCNLEIIIVDDGSTDKCGVICDRYAKDDDRIIVIHQQNGGLSAARNSGLLMATGEYVYFLDSDDYILTRTIEKLLNIAQNNNADVVFFDAEVFFTDCNPDSNVYKYERKKEYSPKKSRQMLLELLESDEYRTAVQLMLLKKNYLTENNLLFLEGILHEDELFTFLVYSADGVVAHCNEKLYQRRMRPSSIMTSSSMKKRFESMLIIYNTLANKYENKEIFGYVSDIYLARIARSVIAKYRILDEDIKLSFKKNYRKFERRVIHDKGYGDIKLKIKCSHGIRNIYYRAIKKLKK